MKQFLLTLILAGLGALALRADPVVQITGGYFERIYTYPTRNSRVEFDYGQLRGSIGGAAFTISMVNTADAVPTVGPTFTDDVSAFSLFDTYLPGMPFVEHRGTLSLDIQAFTNLRVYCPCYPGPPFFQGNHYTGVFSATGSFVGGGMDLPITGGGTTTVDFTTLFDPDPLPGFYFYEPALIRYDFVPVPEPAVMFSTGLGLLALVPPAGDGVRDGRPTRG